MNNLTAGIVSLLGRNLHKIPKHPICLVKEKIFNFFGDKFDKFDSFDPFVSVEDNFDRLLFPKLHPSRRQSEAFYQDDYTMLRTHTSAHQCFLFQQQLDRFLVAGDVYRKDYIDKAHYPVYHQLECVKLNSEHSDMEETIEKLLKYLFPSETYRRVSSYHSYSVPSYDIEVRFGDRWKVVLSYGAVSRLILNDCDRLGECGWSVGINLDRVAMILYNVPDIRWFWVKEQWKENEELSVPFTHIKDISFWLNDNNFNQNEFNSYVWEKAGLSLEEVRWRGSDNPCMARDSKHYQIMYSSLSNPLFGFDDADVLHAKICKDIGSSLNVDIFQRFKC
jgi:phenylalanyl-tRNA synthetase alpha chain